MQCDSLLETLRTHLFAAAAAPRTVRTYAWIAQAFLRFCGDKHIAALCRRDVEGFLARPRSTGRRAAASTRNLEIIALRTLFRATGDHDPTADFTLRRSERRAPSVPTADELRRLFEAAARRPTAARELGMLALLYQAGLRVHELVGLRAEQIDLLGRSIIGLEGKGGSRFDQPLGEEAVALVGAWLARRGEHSGPLFPGRDAASAISVRTVQRLVRRLCGEAGIAKPLTPHSLRHACATFAIVRGVDLPTTAALMRHSRVETTMLYVALASDARRDAANRLGSAIPRAVLPADHARSNSRFDESVLDVQDALCDGSAPDTGTLFIEIANDPAPAPEQRQASPPQLLLGRAERSVEIGVARA